MRFRAAVSFPALAALALVVMAPSAQAAGPSAPAVREGAKIEKLAPGQGGAEEASGLNRAELAAQAQGRRLCFQARARAGGWTKVVCSDEPGFTGSEGKNDPIDRVVFAVGGDLDFNVQLHWANDANTPEYHVPPGYQLELWNNNGNALEAIRLWSSNESMKAEAHVQNVGWKGTNQWSYDQWIGSIGEGRWMEAFWIDI